ncbi:hypothetical protein [Gilvimarinus sp. F26214L]
MKKMNQNVVFNGVLSPSSISAGGSAFRARPTPHHLPSARDPSPAPFGRWAVFYWQLNEAAMEKSQPFVEIPGRGRLRQRNPRWIEQTQGHKQ